MRTLLRSFALLVLPLTVSAYQVSFETTDCDGARGFANVEIELIHRIDNLDCAAGQPAGQLMQVLVRAPGTGYDSFTITAEEAERLRGEMKSYNEARKRSLERGETLQIIPY